MNIIPDLKTYIGTISSDTKEENTARLLKIQYAQEDNKYYLVITELNLKFLHNRTNQTMRGRALIMPESYYQRHMIRDDLEIISSRILQLQVGNKLQDLSDIYKYYDAHNIESRPYKEFEQVLLNEYTTRT